MRLRKPRERFREPPDQRVGRAARVPRGAIRVGQPFGDFHGAGSGVVTPIAEAVKGTAPFPHFTPTSLMPWSSMRFLSLMAGGLAVQRVSRVAWAMIVFRLEREATEGRRLKVCPFMRPSGAQRCLFFLSKEP